MWNRGCIAKSEFSQLLKKTGLPHVHPIMDTSEREVHWMQTLKDFCKESRLATAHDVPPKRKKMAPRKFVIAKDSESIYRIVAMNKKQLKTSAIRN